jgi:hypothetical protein
VQVGGDEQAPQKLKEGGGISEGITADVPLLAVVVYVAAGVAEPDKVVQGDPSIQQGRITGAIR